MSRIDQMHPAGPGLRAIGLSALWPEAQWITALKQLQSVIWKKQLDDVNRVTSSQVSARGRVAKKNVTEGSSLQSSASTVGWYGQKGEFQSYSCFSCWLGLNTQHDLTTVLWNNSTVTSSDKSITQINWKPSCDFGWIFFFFELRLFSQWEGVGATNQQMASGKIKPTYKVS